MSYPKKKKRYYDGRKETGDLFKPTIWCPLDFFNITFAKAHVGISV